MCVIGHLAMCVCMWSYSSFPGYIASLLCIRTISKVPAVSSKFFCMNLCICMCVRVPRACLCAHGCVLLHFQYKKIACLPARQVFPSALTCNLYFLSLLLLFQEIYSQRDHGGVGGRAALLGYCSGAAPASRSLSTINITGEYIISQYEFIYLLISVILYLAFYYVCV